MQLKVKNRGQVEFNENLILMHVAKIFLKIFHSMDEMIVFQPPQALVLGKQVTCNEMLQIVKIQAQKNYRFYWRVAESISLHNH